MAAQNKAPGERIRRNLNQPVWKKLSDNARPVPAWPGPADAPAEAIDYWTAVWSSPMAAMYDDTDQLTIVRASLLHAAAMSGDMMRGRAPDGLSELRQLEDRLGLSPKARRSLQWEIDSAAGNGTAAKGAEVHPIDERRAEREKRRERLSQGS